MKLTAELDGEQHTLHVRRDHGRVNAEIDGRRYELEVREPEPGVLLLLADGHVYECRVERDAARPEARSVYAGGRVYTVTLTDPKRLRGAQRAGAHTAGPAQVIAPMPGKVVRVLVEAGAEVEAGEGLVVVEAMKMQNEMKSPRAGTVVELRAQAGATVNAGDVLAVVE